MGCAGDIRLKAVKKVKAGARLSAGMVLLKILTSAGFDLKAKAKVRRNRKFTSQARSCHLRTAIKPFAQ
jgi:hypothetical protein